VRFERLLEGLHTFLADALNRCLVGGNGGAFGLQRKLQGVMMFSRKILQARMSFHF
jgi:hypothetical protein